jgi:hypothetical protein
MSKGYIEPEDLLWHINATRRELEKYYTPATNAINRIAAIERAVKKILEKKE